jgi:hypothetical protein
MSISKNLDIYIGKLERERIAREGINLNQELKMHMHPVYRNKPIPYEYTRIPYVRKDDSGLLLDCKEDFKDIKYLQDLLYGGASGRINGCISVFKPLSRIIVMAEVPLEILDMNGKSGIRIRYTIYYWLPRDAKKASFDNGIRPYESVTLQEAKIDHAFLESIALTSTESTCFPDDGEEGISFTI